jgi:hypothetical protein
MRYATWAFVAVLTAAVVSTGVCATAGKAPESPKAPPGWVLVQEDVLVVLADEPEHHLKLAHEHFLKKEHKEAASEIRKAAAFVKLAADNAAGEDRKGLLAAGAELDRLADGVEKGTVTSERELKEAFARADYALARHHQIKAAEANAAKEPKKAGQHLKAAADAVEDGAAWAGHELGAGGVDAIKGARLVSGKLIEGVGWVPAEVGKAITDIGKETEKLGKVIAPHKPA